jgi:hypothetical protein
MNHYNSGPIFGEGYDIFIADQCNRSYSWCNLGKSYTFSRPYGSDRANRELAGEVKFIVEDYEIWSVYKNK